MLYLIATPIGNLKDISLRALETLQSVDEIACEDTRHSLSLLNHYDIKKPLFSYHKFNEQEISEKIIKKLESGLNIAVISDAGTPCISDPGNVLIKKVIEKGLEYTVIPGACAFVNALVLSGVDTDRFCFIGFLPDKSKDRVELLERYKNLDMSLIFYCAPHDVKKDIDSIYKVFGDRKACAVKEITKIYEKVERFNLKDGIEGQPKGEYVLIVEGQEAVNHLLELNEKEHIDYYIAKGYDKKEAIKIVAKERGVSKSSLYKYTIEG